MSEQKDPLEAKKDAFYADPGRFVDTDTLIIALGRSDKGPTLFLKPKSRQELIQAFAELQIVCIKEIIKVDGMAHMSKKIIAKPNGIMGFVKGKFRR